MSLIDSVERLRAGLDYHLARQNLLTANLAHIDTPGFKPLDLQRKSDFESALHTELRATNPGHLGAAGPGDQVRASFKVFEDQNAAVGADGNSVSVDREAVKLAANQVRYDAIAQLTSGELAGLAWAADDGKGG